ncbi:MAG: hypothetical protein NZM26_05605, partial [Patescibacteria group bacterium]|nr:hypothetical protein [Patescibacteria group bacterium]
GFFMILSSRDIIIDNSVGGPGLDPHVEGLLIAGARFLSGVHIPPASLPDRQLRLRGILISAQSPSLVRSLPNNAIAPAEVFDFAPDVFMRIPTDLRQTRVKWSELNP